MKQQYLFLLLFLSSTVLWAQRIGTRDPRYLEDQLYFGFTYNLLTNQPTDVSQGGLSNGIELGFIRDIPLNKRRNIGMAIGLGWSNQTYFQNLAMGIDPNGTSYNSILTSSDYKSNKFNLSTVDLPIEFRYRTSTVDRFKFFRLYPGFKVSWVYKNSSTLNDGTRKVSYYNFSEFNDFIYGPTLKVGYGPWTLSLFYSINSLFKKGDQGMTIEENKLGGTIGEAVEMHSLNIGLILYLL